MVIARGLDRCRNRAASCGPVLDLQSGDFLEVPEVRREKRRVADEGDRRDLEIHRPDADYHSAESLQLRGGPPLEVEDLDGPEIVQAPIELAVRPDLLNRTPLSQPPSRLLLVGDDRCGDLLNANREETSQDPHSSRRFGD